MFVFVSFDRFRLQALEHCLCAGEPINPEVMWKWKDLTGLNIYEGYGQTETVRLIRFFLLLRNNIIVNIAFHSGFNSRHIQRHENQTWVFWKGGPWI